MPSCRMHTHLGIQSLGHKVATYLLSFLENDKQLTRMVTLFVLARVRGPAPCVFMAVDIISLFGREPLWWVCNAILVFAFPKWKMMSNTFHTLNKRLLHLFLIDL